jgi:hypothetical protein
MRLLLLLIIAGVAAYYTNPTREAHEAKARVALQSYQPSAAAAQGGDLVQNAISFVTGMAAGQGRYESYYLFSKYTLDMPGVQYLECYGAYTVVSCRVVEPGAAG